MVSVVKDGLGQVRSGWVLLVFAAAAGALYVAQMVVLAVLRLDPVPPLQLDDPRLILSSAALLFSAWGATLLCKLAFGAEAGASRQGAIDGLLIGFAAGAVVVSICSLAGLGNPLATIHWGGAGVVGTLISGLTQLLTIGPTSVGEELLLRGVVLRQLARGTSPAVAVLATGGVFGAMHLGNPSVSWVAALNIALVGIWFGALAWRTGTLWTSIALHVTWNWFEGFVFGTPVSGIEPAASIWVVSPGPGSFWSGGSFGPEAAGFTTLVLGAACIATLFWPRPRATARPDSSAPAPGTAG